jgi:hypothetical protein
MENYKRSLADKIKYIAQLQSEVNQVAGLSE